MMNEHGKSDRPVVPVKSSNKAGAPSDRSSSLGWKAGQPAAEGMEGRGLTKGNPLEQNAFRTQSRSNAPSALERIRQAASKDNEMRFAALFHHISAPEALRTAYLCLKREGMEKPKRARRRKLDTAKVNLKPLSALLRRTGCPP